MGKYQAKYREKDEDDEPQDEDSPVIVRFGDLFQVRMDFLFPAKWHFSNTRRVNVILRIRTCFTF